MSEMEIDGWYVFELMGHRKLAGKATSVQIGGQVMLRLDIPNGDGFTTQLYNPSALYCITPCSEEVARQFSERVQPEPVHQWEMKLLPAEADAYDMATEDEE
jgi:hypothetical protein